MQAPTHAPVAARPARKPAIARLHAPGAPIALPAHGPFLPKLKFGSRDDPAERQADRIADHVVAHEVAETTTACDTGSAAPSVPPAPLPPADGDGDGIASRVLRALRFGRPLPSRERADMETRFGADFSGVRVHTDAGASAIAAEINAHAFAVGEHIAFADGAYRPETTQGRHLLAHELAHVVQARAARGDDASVHREEGESNWFSDLVDTGGRVIASAAYSLLERVAPQVVPVLKQGPLPWLQDKLGRTFDGIVATFTSLVPVNALDALGATFGGLLDRAGGILSALVSGDCQPLFDAIGELKTFVTEVAGVAWQRLTDFLRPVGNFFTDLWNGYGAPAVAWLERTAGAVWQEIRGFASYLWQRTAGIRESAASTWDWIKRQLFGSQDQGDGGSEEGLIGWVTRKAGEAWDWVKEQTRPVWQPVVDAMQALAPIPPPFLADLGQQMQGLSGQLNQTAGQMEAGAAGRPIAENRAALAAALPSVNQIIQRVRGLLVSGGQWLLDKLGGMSQGVADFMARLRANRILSLLATALGWLESAARALFAWCQEKVVAMFTTLVEGFDALTPFFERILGVVRSVIDVMGDLMRLPTLIAGTLWKAIPECIREPVKNFLVQQILGRIPVFGQFFTNPDLWARVQQTALEIMRQLFVDGNLAGAAWTFFQAMLRVLGLPAELVVRILAKAAQAIGDVLRDPIGFLGNLLRAMRAGFGLFFDNVGTHLLNGFTGWLFGHLSSAGIRPPADFSIRSVLGFALEVLGITVENVFHRLSQRVGDTVVQRLRRMLDVATGAWSFVTVLVNEGPAGLWQEIQGRLSNLWNGLVDGAVAWLMDRVIARATRWLMSLLDVTGIMPIINTLVAVYDAIESFVQYLREILELVSRVLDGVIGIAAGQIDEAAGFLERAMADSLPVAIGFLANQFGLSNIGTRIQELLAPVRTRIDGAIDWLIERAITAGQAVLDMARRGASAVQGAVARVRDWWRERFGFRGPQGEPHNVYFEGQGASARLMVASDPMSFAQFIRKHGPKAPAETVAEAEALYEELLELQRRLPPGGAPSGAEQGTHPDPGPDIARVANALAATCGQIMAASGGGTSTPPIYGPLQDGFGKSVVVERLTEHHVPGDQPTVSGGRWDTLNRRRSGGGTYYIRGHLLNHLIGGPGNTWANLTPLTRSANSDMHNSFEQHVKAAVNDGRKTMRVVVTAHYGRQATADTHSAEDDAGDEDATVIQQIRTAESAVPLTIDCLATEVGGKSKEIRASIPNEIDVASYDLSDTPKPTVYFNEATETALARLPDSNEEIVERIRKNRPFRTRDAFMEIVEPPRTWFGPGARIRIRLYSRS